MEPWEEEEGPEVVKRFMYVNRRAPYGTIYALECLEVVLIAAAFDQDVSVVFVDDGVYQLKKDQDTTGIGMKNFSKTYRALDDYDVEKIYVEKESLEERGLTADDLIIPVEVVAAARSARDHGATGRGDKLMSKMLHLVNKSPFDRNALDSCLRLAQAGSSVLLLEDGVYAALKKAASAEAVSERMEDLAFYVSGARCVSTGPG